MKSTLFMSRPPTGVDKAAAAVNLSSALIAAANQSFYKLVSFNKEDPKISWKYNSAMSFLPIYFSHSFKS